MVFSNFTHVAAQTIIIDPSAPGTVLRASGNGTPLIDISTPVSGVSLNKYSQFNVTADGVILNNSTVDGVSTIGAGVTANPNLMVSGPASIIVNEVTSNAQSTLAGTVELFGAQAQVIIANQNGITCNGCAFIGSDNVHITTGAVGVNGSAVDFTVSKGTINIGDGSLTTDSNLSIYGRHIIVNDSIETTNQSASTSLTVSGGSQFVDLQTGIITAAPILNAKDSPFSVDIGQVGGLTSGNVNLISREAGLDVNVYADVDAKSDATLQSAGNLFYQNLLVGNDLNIDAAGDIRQYGDATAAGDITLSGNSVTIYSERSLAAGGDVTITAADLILVVGEVTAQNIALTSTTGSIINSGFVLADGELTIVAGETVSQERKIVAEYDIYFDPALAQYVEAYQFQLLEGGDQALAAAELLARAAEFETIGEYILKGASLAATNIDVNAGVDVQNTGGAMAATNDILLTAGANIINEYLALRHNVIAAEGCDTGVCGSRLDFHAGEILAGNDLVLIAGLNIENRASDMAAANTVVANAGQDIVNALMTSEYVDNLTGEVELIGAGLVVEQICSSYGKGGSCNQYSYNYSVVDSTFTTTQVTYDEGHILAPGRIASLYGGVTLNAARDFISIGSEISAGTDLVISAGSEVILSSYTDVEADFVMQSERNATASDNIICNKSGCWVSGTTGSEWWSDITYDGTRLVSAATNLVAGSISIASQNENISMMGVRLLSAGDLSLNAINGSILVDSTDLPDTALINSGGAVTFVELDADPVAQIFGTAEYYNTPEYYTDFYTSLLSDAAVSAQADQDLLENIANSILDQVASDLEGAATSATASTALSVMLADPEQLRFLADSVLAQITDLLNAEIAAQGVSNVASSELVDLLTQLEGTAGEIPDATTDALINQIGLILVAQLEADELANPVVLPFRATVDAAFTDASRAGLIASILDIVEPEIPPVGATDAELDLFASLSVNADYMREVSAQLVNAVAIDLGETALIVLDATTGEYDFAGVDAGFLEENSDLQRIVLEVSYLLQEQADTGVGTKAQLATDILAEATSVARSDLIAGKLTELNNLLIPEVEALLDQRINAALIATLAARDLSAVLTDAAALANSSTVIDDLAASLGQGAFDEAGASIVANSTLYLTMLAQNDLLTAVEGLRRAASGAEIHDAVRNVGVQSFVSLLDEDGGHDALASANSAVLGVYTTLQTDLATMDQSITTYYDQVDQQLAVLTANLNLTDAEALAQIALDVTALETTRDASLLVAQSDYEAELAAILAQYGSLLTTEEQYCISYFKGGCFSWGTQTVLNDYYVALKDAADQQTLVDFQAANDLIATEHSLDVASAQIAYEDAALQAEMAALNTAFDTQLLAFEIDRSLVVSDLADDFEVAMAAVSSAIDYDTQIAALRAEAVAAGSVIDGEISLAAALTKQTMPEIALADGLSLTLGGFVENTREYQVQHDTVTTVTQDVGEWQDLVTSTTETVWIITGKGSGYYQDVVTETTETVWVITGTEQVDVIETTFETLTSVAPLISSDKTEQDNFIAATAWRFATNGALNELSATPRSIVYSDADLSLNSGEDIYVTGATTVSAGGDIDVTATRRIGLLGAVDSGFRLTNDAHAAFTEIGETLQLGTLMRDPTTAEVTGDTATAGDTLLSFAESTQLYSLSTAAISAGGNLSLSTSGDVVSFGGSVIAGDNLYVTADGDIRNEALRYNFTLTEADGCGALACGELGQAYKPAEMLAGSGMLLTSGADIVNLGSTMAAAGSLLADAQGDIRNTALTSQYLYYYVNSCSFFCLIREKQLLYRAAISKGSIATEFGDLTLNAGNDVLVEASSVSSGGDISITATQDVDLLAKSEELNNYYHKSGFGFLSYSSDTTEWNEFDTALTQIEGNNVSITAGRDLTGIGVTILAADDIDMVAGEDLTLDAHQNLRYERRSGWSFGLSFGGSDILAALASGDGQAALEAYIGTNPALAAVHQLATAKDHWGTLNGLLNLGYHGPAFLASVSDGSSGVGGDPTKSISVSLAKQLNPFIGLENNRLITGKTYAGDDGKEKIASFFTGISFRFNAYSSSRDWTESHISRVIAGRDLWLDAGQDLSLVGGTMASASQDAMLYAGDNILMSALADNSVSSSSGWGLSLGFTESGFTFGANANTSNGLSTVYSNAAVTAGGALDVISGLDTVLVGANSQAHDIYMDVGQDLIVESRQNTSTSDSHGFNFSVTLAPNGAPTAFSFGANASTADRIYTDTPTSIVANDRLSIYTGRNTILLGSAVYSEVGNLNLDTGNLLFDNYDDSDTSGSVGINISIDLKQFDKSDPSGSLAYSDTQAITYATLGAGTINVRAPPVGFSLDALNRDPDHVQEIISETEFAIEIPGVNLKQWRENVTKSGNLIKAISADIPQKTKDQGALAVDLYRDMILSGIDPAEVRALAGSREFRAAVDGRRRVDELLKKHGKGAVPKEELLFMALTQGALFNAAGQAVMPIVCLTYGTECEAQLSFLVEIYGQFITESLKDNPDPDLLRQYGKFGIGNAFRNFILACSDTQPHLIAQFMNDYGPDAVKALAEAHFGSQTDSRLALGFDGDMLVAAISTYDPFRNGGEFTAAIVESRMKFLNDNGLIDTPEQHERFMLLMGFTPFVGTAIDGHNLYKNVRDGNYYAATADGGMLLISLIPGGKIIGKGVGKTVEWAADLFPAKVVDDLVVTARSTIGFTQDTVSTAYEGMNKGGGHAIRKYVREYGFIPDSGSLTSRVEIFKNLTQGILTNPTATFNWKLRGLDTRGFMGQVNGADVWVLVAKSGPYQGKVMTSFVPDAVQLAEAGF